MFAYGRYPRVTCSYPKVTNSYPRVIYSYPRVAYSDPKVTHSDPTHLPLPPPTSPAMHLAISQTNETSGGWEGGNQL